MRLSGKTKLTAILICSFGFLLFATTAVDAAPYGSATYGECEYSADNQCPPPQVIPPQEPEPVDEEPAVNEESPPVVTRDIDGDGTEETAEDTNNDESDGYESFISDDEDATEVATIDGDDDSKTDFLIDTDGNGAPDRYWDPDDDFVSTIQPVDCDGDGQPEYRFDNGRSLRNYDTRSGVIFDECQPPVGGPAEPDSSDNTRPITGSILQNSSVYKEIGELVKKVPAPIAYSFPYALLLALMAIAGRLIWQSKNEIKRFQVIAKTIEAEKQLALEKDNFLMLTSHYLRTPITIVRGSIETLQSLQQITDEIAATLNQAGQLLLDQVTLLLERVSTDQRLAAIQPSQQKLPLKAILTPYFMLPIAGIVGLLIISQLLFMDFQVTSPSFIDLLVQAALAILLIQVLVSKRRQHELNRRNRRDQERILEKQRDLDEARSQFINEVADRLEQQLQQFQQQIDKLDGDKSEMKMVSNSLDQLSQMVAKFRLVALLQRRQLGNNTSDFALAQLMQDVVEPYTTKAQEKNIAIEQPDAGNLEHLYQEKHLLTLVLQSLIDNAIKYAPENSAVAVTAHTDGEQVKFAVHDDGSGIPKDKQALLFRPFSRTESAETFNTEGMGFSLYLDKLIAHYLHGDIAVDSDKGKGTTVTVAVPARI